MSTSERVGSYIFTFFIGALAAIIVVTACGRAPVDMYTRGVLDQMHGRAIIVIESDTSARWP